MWVRIPLGGLLCECGNAVFIKKTGECKTCYHRRYYREKRRPSLIAYLGDCCARCGSTDDLQFDHIDPALKSFDIRDNLTLNAKVRAELDKCQLLCAPCHRQKTARENAGILHGTSTGWMKSGCTCEVCTAAKWAWHDERNARRRKPGGRGPYKTARR